MSERRLIHRNKISGLRAYGHFDSDGNMPAVTEEYDHASADSCAQYNSFQRDNRKSTIGNTQDHMRHAATIPPVFVNQLMREGRWATQDPDAFKQWLYEDCPRDIRGTI